MAKRTSDEAVQRATGKVWKEWFAILDKAGAKKMQHRDIVLFLFNKYLGKGKGNIGATSPNGWWSQMVTVEYERERGMRKVNQNETGFLVGMHKTLNMSAADFEKEWDTILRSKKVAGHKLERVPSRTKRNMLRYRAKVGGLVVTYDVQPSRKLRVMVEAIRLPNSAAVERERKFWRGILEAIAE